MDRPVHKTIQQILYFDKIKRGIYRIGQPAERRMHEESTDPFIVDVAGHWMQDRKGKCFRHEACSTGYMADSVHGIRG